MNLTTKEHEQIKKQIAHIMFVYGDNPSELIYKLELLVIEWHDKGRKQSGSR